MFCVVVQLVGRCWLVEIPEVFTPRQTGPVQFAVGRLGCILRRCRQRDSSAGPFVLLTAAEHGGSNEEPAAARADVRRSIALASNMIEPDCRWAFNRHSATGGRASTSSLPYEPRDGSDRLRIIVIRRIGRAAQLCQHLQHSVQVRQPWAVAIDEFV